MSTRCLSLCLAPNSHRVSTGLHHAKPSSNIPPPSYRLTELPQILPSTRGDRWQRHTSSFRGRTTACTRACMRSRSLERPSLMFYRPLKTPCTLSLACFELAQTQSRCSYFCTAAGPTVRPEDPTNTRWVYVSMIAVLVSLAEYCDTALPVVLTVTE
ncbi:hypothetical protein BV25DRAFT_1055413 [Artomyces pyxidatus]|uniref:Uncharacterized protein n=1 Tax=Artomyces pyxidatus TaxID=48021 RepID=A0ACB8STV8_9AGAM|nr:hypothetical protein BV25DRAFT_1055413 [Artomyces pyxidatus]